MSTCGGTDKVAPKKGSCSVHKRKKKVTKETIVVKNSNTLSLSKNQSLLLLESMRLRENVILPENDMIQIMLSRLQGLCNNGV